MKVRAMGAFLCALVFSFQAAAHQGEGHYEVSTLDSSSGLLTIPCVRLINAAVQAEAKYSVTMRHVSNYVFAIEEVVAGPETQACSATYTPSTRIYSDRVYASGRVYEILMQDVPGTGFRLLRAVSHIDCKTQAVATEECRPFHEAFDLANVEKSTIASTLHVQEPTYADFPPTGGDHHPCWASWGMSTREVPAKHFVHNLEHGGVVFLYDCPDGCNDELTWLRTFVDTNVAGSVLVAPQKGLPRKFAALAWGARLLSNTLNAATFQKFYTTYKNKAPEFVLSEPPAECTGIF